MADLISLVASPIISMAIEKLASLIQEEVVSLRGFEKNIETLQKKFEDIQKVLEIAEKTPRKSEVRNLLEDLKDAAYDAQDVLDTLSTQVLLWNEKQQQVRFLPSCAKEHINRLQSGWIANDIKNIIERFTDIQKRFSEMKDMLSLVTPEFHDKGKEESQFTSPVMHQHVVGRLKEKNNLLEILKSDAYSIEGRVSVIPITGMGGIGKTTLAQQVYNDSETIKLFQARIWISVADRDNFINWDRIYREIIKSCAKDYMPQGSLDALVQHSVEGLKIFVVLDDVWSDKYEDWKKLETVLMTADRGSRVIVTSRRQNVFGLDTKISLDKLPHEDCLKLFAKNAIDGDESDLVKKGVREVADEFVKKCDGLPLAAEAIGCLLRSYPPETWANILNNDLTNIEEELGGENHRIFSVLRLSFYYLSPELKQCFALCSIFPKGHLYDRDELVKFWMAHSLVLPSKLAETPEDKGRRYFDRLAVLSFFQKQPESEMFRMHDYMHDLAESVSGKYLCIIKNENPTGISPKTLHISLLSERVEAATKVVNKCKRLRTFLMAQPRHSLRDFGEALSKMFLTIKYIRVLDLSSSTVSQLPKTVAELKLLGYLNLSRTGIKWLPNAICSLLNLQTLKLLDCPWFLRLPRDLSRLVNLRHLEIDEAFWKFKCSVQPPWVGRLNNLHNLHKFWVGESRKGYGIEELNGMKYLEGSLHITELDNAVIAAQANLIDKPRLEALELEWNGERNASNVQGKSQADYDAEVLEDLKPHSRLKELRIRKYFGKKTPSWLSRGHLEFLSTLYLDGCKNLEALTLGRQPKLAILSIKNMQELKELAAEMECPSLHTLKVCDCPHLTRLPDFVSKLGVLRIKRCNSLKTIPLPTNDPTIFELVDNPVLEGFQFEGSNTVCLDDLGFEDLGAFIWRCKITGCPKFQGIRAKYYNSCSASINSKLEIGECEAVHFHPSRPLTQLTVHTCNEDALLKAMKEISDYRFTIRSDTGVSIHYLQALTISGISNLFSFPTSLQVNLTSLYIWACNDLKSLFDATKSCKESFPCLITLSIGDCPKLSKFPEEGLPSKLELLLIKSCPNLESLGSPGLFKDLTCLVDVYIENCPKIQSFPSEGFPSSLKHLRIRGCQQLIERCNDQNGGGPDWPRIMNIPYLEIEKVPSKQHASSAASTCPKISLF